MGSLLPTMNDNVVKNIPDGKLKDFEVPPGSGTYTTRCPMYGQVN